MSDLISRQAAIDIERNATVDTNPSHFEAHQKFTQFMDDAEISSFGRWQWSNGFNTALTAVGIDLKKLPAAQPEPCEDTVSRQRLLSDLKELVAAWKKYTVMAEQIKGVEAAIGYVEAIPSAQPERTCVNCGRTVNNGGWYADGRTRCPIEEHYALPKDGYCHLWEKRNVTYDDYPERREE